MPGTINATIIIGKIKFMTVLNNCTAVIISSKKNTGIKLSEPTIIPKIIAKKSRGIRPIFFIFNSSNKCKKCNLLRINDYCLNNLRLLQQSLQHLNKNKSHQHQIWDDGDHENSHLYNLG